MVAAVVAKVAVVAEVAEVAAVAAEAVAASAVENVRVVVAKVADRDPSVDRVPKDNKRVDRVRKDKAEARAQKVAVVDRAEKVVPARGVAIKISRAHKVLAAADPAVRVVVHVAAAKVADRVPKDNKPVVLVAKAADVINKVATAHRMVAVTNRARVRLRKDNRLRLRSVKKSEASSRSSSEADRCRSPYAKNTHVRFAGATG